MAKATSKDNSWEATLAKLDKDFGKGSIINATEKPEEIETISTGSLNLDIATGVGGYPEGRIIEIYGPFSSGKTTLCLHAIAQGQKKHPEKKFVFIDVEHALDIKYTKSLGVDLERLKISQPGYGEEALEIASRLLETGEVGVMVIDSVAALVPKKEIDGEMGDSSIGSQARLMGQAMRKLTGIVQKTGALLIFTNQIREKIGVMFGSPEVTSGGNALKFYASMRLDIRKKATNKDSTSDDAVSISNTVKVKIIKNKVAPPFTEADFDIEFGIGIDKVKEIFEEGISKGIISKAGGHHKYNDSYIGHTGKESLQFLRDNPELANEIEAKILTADEQIEEISISETMTEDIPFEEVENN